jgi:uncharacterized protein YndB with AHSA1/START domain
VTGDVVVVRRVIQARPATVFSFFTQRDRWLEWQGRDAEIDAAPGGVFRVNVRGDGWASGRFTVVDPPRRLEFTWGWEDTALPVPRDHRPWRSRSRGTAAGGTLLTLVHSGLPLAVVDLHRDGWEHYLDRLAVRSVGGDPGPDPS